MIYLDYSATTKTDKKVLDEFNRVNSDYFGNPNSNYEIAYAAKNEIDNATNKIAKYLHVKPNEIIYTSGASESNNMAIKKIAMLETRKHIITTPFEHSSINSPLSYLQSLGKKVTFVKTDNNGIVDINDLLNQITDDTFLVSIGAVNSEVGFRQPIEKIGELLKDKNLVFHSDITQCLGKDTIDLTNVDLASFSAHKIYGIKGIGGLIKKEKVKIIPLIHGGKSTTIYRSGTPQTDLICSMAKAMEIVMNDIRKNQCKVKEYNEIIQNYVKKYSKIIVNSNEHSIPQILNISILGIKSDDIQKYFANHNIYLSTKTACSSDNELSNAVLSYTNNEELAKSSIRISISHKTTSKEIRQFIKVLDKLMVKHENN